MTNNKKSNRDIKAQVRFTTKEASYIDNKAYELGLNRSKWIRKQCLEENVPITPETMEYIETLENINRQLAPIGNNVNQIARAINTARASGLDIPKTLDEEFLWRLYSEIRELKDSIAMLTKTSRPEHI